MQPDNFYYAKKKDEKWIQESDEEGKDTKPVMTVSKKRDSPRLVEADVDISTPDGPVHTDITIRLRIKAQL
jgi:hypothetical protein